MEQNEKNEDISKKEFFRRWLEKLQQESWQLELLISGLALFGIYESKSWINDFVLHVNTFTYGFMSSFTGPIKLLLESGWTIFFINLLIHVILRGLWIGAIGLRYVSQEIDYDHLGYSDRFTAFLKKNVGDYDDFIERLEKICSVLFAYTFLLFLLLLSLILFFSVTFLIGILMQMWGDGSQPHPILLPFIFLYITLGLIVFIDFITLGGFKKINEPLVSKVYMWIYRFFSVITLSFLYRPLLYNFIDNGYTRKLFFLSIPYIFLIIFYNSIIDNEMFPHWSSDEAKKYGLYMSKISYEDERAKWYNENDMQRELKKEKLPLATLSQFMVDKPYLEIFIKMLGNDQYMLTEMDSLSPYKKAGLRFSLFSNNKHENPVKEKLELDRLDATRNLRTQRKEIRKRKFRSKNKSLLKPIDSLTVLIDSINEIWYEKEDRASEIRLNNTISTMLGHAKLSIDGKSILSEIDCYKYEHPNFKELGLLCVYSMDSIDIGKHIFSVERDYYSISSETLREDVLKIPFYKVAR